MTRVDDVSMEPGNSTSMMSVPARIWEVAGRNSTMSLITPTLGVKTAHTPVATTMMTKIRWRNLTKKLALAVSTDDSVCSITCGFLHGTWWRVRHARESGQVRARLTG